MPVTAPWTSAPPRPLSVALGGGGGYGIGFHLGILKAFAEQGIPVAAAPMMGVSAGSWAAAALAIGIGIDEVEDNWRGPVLRDRRGRVDTADLTSRLFGDARDGRVTGAALRLPQCRRVLLNGAQHPLSLAVAASSAPPGLAIPPVVAGERLYDAGVLYNTCADQAASAKALLVVAPLAHGALGMSGLVFERRLHAEVAMWALRHRGRVVVIRPSQEVAATGARSLRDMLSVEAMRPTERLAYRQGLDMADNVRRRLGLDGSVAARAA